MKKYILVAVAILMLGVNVSAQRAFNDGTHPNSNDEWGAPDKFGGRTLTAEDPSGDIKEVQVDESGNFILSDTSTAPVKMAGEDSDGTVRTINVDVLGNPFANMGVWTSSFTPTNETTEEILIGSESCKYLRGVTISSPTPNGVLTIYDSRGSASSTIDIIPLKWRGTYTYYLKVSSGVTYTTTGNSASGVNITVAK